MVDIPGDNTTTETIAIGGIYSGEIEIAGDRDWIAVTLLAGQSYSISLSTPGLNGLKDSFLSIFDAAGVLVASDDDGGANLDSLATFTPEASGTYYIEARAFGKGIGTYQIAVEETAPPSFLDSIDWGSQISNPAIKVYFANAGEVFDGKTSLGWNAYEQQQAMLAFQQYANVCNVSFEVTADQTQATFTLVTKGSAPWLGYFNPPGTANEGVGVFNRSGDGWDEDAPGTGGLEQGGYGFVTMLHEFGHGMGMAHPHDSGGTSTTWEGVTDAFGSYGTFDLNQGIYTVMSYNDGWQLHPAGQNTANEYGWEASLMAFDVAMMQELYGANTSFHAGDDSYVLPDQNLPGTYFACLWDAGGTDEIVYGGARNIIIDLRAAHLGYAEGSGGYVSFAQGIYGGFTIANGVVIENAAGGTGGDGITGNAAANKLTGLIGNDRLFGLEGNDQILGGGGRDTICGGAGVDRLNGALGADIFVFLDLADTGATRLLSDKIAFHSGEDLIDLGALDALTGGTADDAFDFIGTAGFSGVAGELRCQAVSTGVVVSADRDGDRQADLVLTLLGAVSVVETDFVL